MSQFKTANINSVVDLRSATDEKLPNALSQLGYTESFKLIDTKLAIGYLSAVIAAITFYIEKNLSFSEGLLYTKILIGLYTILSAIEWIHSKFIHKDIIYQGYKKNQNIEIHGTIDKYKPEYELSILIKSKQGKPINIKTTLLFTEIFDKFGNLHESQLNQWVKLQIESNLKDKKSL